MRLLENVGVWTVQNTGILLRTLSCWSRALPFGSAARPLPGERILLLHKLSYRTLPYVIFASFLLVLGVLYPVFLQTGLFLGDPGLVGKGFAAALALLFPPLVSLLLALRHAGALAVEMALSRHAGAPDSSLQSAISSHWFAFSLAAPLLGVFAWMGAFAGGFCMARLFQVDFQRFLVFGPVPAPLWLMGLLRMAIHGGFIPAAAAAAAHKAGDPPAPDRAAGRAFGASALMILSVDGIFLAGLAWTL